MLNFLDAVPSSMRLLILVKNPGIRTSASMAIDELFLLAKEIAAAEKLVGGTKNTVMVVNQDTGDKNPYGEAWGVFPINSNRHNEGRTSTCHNCGSTAHLSRDCDKQKRCYNCNQFGHIQHNCPTINRPPVRNFNRGGDFRGGERRYPDRDREMNDGNSRSHYLEDNNSRPNNTFSSNARRNGDIPQRGQPGGQGVNINIVEAEGVGGDPRVSLGAIKDIAVINVE